MLRCIAISVAKKLHPEGLARAGHGILYEGPETPRQVGARPCPCWPSLALCRMSQASGRFNAMSESSSKPEAVPEKPSASRAAGSSAVPTVPQGMQSAWAAGHGVVR